jgi:hypothetical protein
VQIPHSTNGSSGDRVSENADRNRDDRRFIERAS